MAFTALASSDIAVDRPVTNELMTNIKDDLDYLYGVAASNNVTLINPSFEIDSNSDSVPDNWTFTPYAGGAGALSTVDPHHGEKAFVFTRTSGAGNGGGELLSDYIAITTGLQYELDFALKQSSAQPRTKFIAQFYTKAKTTLADSTIYNSTANPTAWTEYRYSVQPPTNARYCKILIVGGATDKDNAGTISVDNLNLIRTEYGPLTTGTDLILSQNTVARATTSTSLTLLKRTSAMVRQGDVLASFHYQFDNSQVQLYRNGSAVGSLNGSTLAVGATAVETTNISIQIGDILQIYGKAITSTGLSLVTVSSFYVTANDPEVLKDYPSY